MDGSEKVRRALSAGMGLADRVMRDCTKPVIAPVLLLTPAMLAGGTSIG